MDIAGTVSGAYAASTSKSWVDDGVTDKSPVIYRHNLQANVVFADGHVESRRWGSIPDDDFPGWTNCRTKSFFWSPLSPDY
jgi:prepilin-type processing-associated H-X9-DG protein